MSAKSQTISAVLVTENVAATLEATLASLRWADEIVIVDRGSTDDTLAIAQGATDRIFFHPGSSPDAAWHYGYQQAVSHWILRIQPWEVVEDLLKHEIDGIMLNPSQRADAYRVRRRAVWGKKPLEHSAGLFIPEIRLFRKSSDHLERLLPGYAPYPDGAVIRSLDHALSSIHGPSLETLFFAVNRESTDIAYTLLERMTMRERTPGGPQLLFKAIGSFLATYVFQGACLDGFGGLAMAYAHSHKTFLAWAKLRQLASVTSP